MEAKPAAQPKVFQRFLVKKEPLIDRSVPPKERTKVKELEGIGPGKVKSVHDVAQTTPAPNQPASPVVPPPAAAAPSQEREDAQEVKAAAKEGGGPSPTPPPLPPRPSGYEVTNEPTTTPAADGSEQGGDQAVAPTSTPQVPETTETTTPSVKEESQSAAPAVDLPSVGRSQEKESQEDVENSTVSSVDQQSQVQLETQTTAELQPTMEAPPDSKEEVVVLPKVNTDKESLETEEKEKDTGMKQPSLDSEVKVETQPTAEAPTTAGAEESVADMKPQEQTEEVSKDQEKVQEEEEREEVDGVEVQLPEQDTQARLEPQSAEPTRIDEDTTELDTEVKVEPQPAGEAPPVCTDVLCPLPRTRDEGQKGEEKIEEEANGESQLIEPGKVDPESTSEDLMCTDLVCPLPEARDEGSKEDEKEDNVEPQVPEPDSEIKQVPQPTVEAASKEEHLSPTEAERSSQDDRKETEVKESGETDQPEAVVEEGENKLATASASLIQDEAESPADQLEREANGSTDHKGTTAQSEADQKPSEETKREPSKVTESPVDKSQGEIDQSETTEPHELGAVAEPGSPKQEQQEGEEVSVDQEVITAQVDVPAVVETATTQEVIALKSQSEGTNGATDSSSAPLPLSEQAADEVAGQPAQEETNEAISEDNRPIVEEQSRRLDEAPVSEVESGSYLRTEKDDLTTNQTPSVKPLEEEEQSSAAAIEVASREELPEEEVKSKTPPLSGAQDKGEERDQEEGELAPPPPVGGALPPPPPPPPPPVAPPPPSIGIRIPKGPPKAEEVKRKVQGVKPPQGAMAHEEAMAAIKGGVRLRSVPAPVQRSVGEEKIVDVASELRQKMLKQRKKEVCTSNQDEGEGEIG